jgi:hypothetical protein
MSITFKSNSQQGDSFMNEYSHSMGIFRKSQELFEVFLKKHQIDAWHTHDSWVMHDYRSGIGVVNEQILDITWIGDHDWSHNWICPRVDQKVVITKFLDINDNIKPFKVHIFRVIEYTPGTFGSSDRIKVSRVETKEIVFCLEKNEYMFFTEEKMLGFFDWISNYFSK